MLRLLCLLHGTQHDIRHLPGAWKLQQEKNEARNIVRLDKVLRLVWPPLRRKDCALPLACRSSKKNRCDAHAMAIDLVS